mgnify:CR=1 FL=1
MNRFDSMDCKRIEGNLSAFVARELSADEAATVASHIDACASCRESLAAFVALLALHGLVLTVGLLHALYALKGRMPSKRQLMLESIHIEQERLKETVGSQDQASAAHGGLNHIAFLPEGEIAVRPVTLTPERRREFGRHLMLFYSGIQRTASDVAKTYVEDIEAKKAQLRTMTNLVAMLTHGGRGGEVLLEDGSHTLNAELGGIASIAGLFYRGIPGRRGAMDVR